MIRQRLCGSIRQKDIENKRKIYEKVEKMYVKNKRKEQSDIRRRNTAQKNNDKKRNIRQKKTHRK